MKYRILFLLFVLIFAGCGDEDYGLSGNGNNDPGPYSIESQPSISPDGRYIYYIAEDTTYGLYGGIYRSKVDTPLREKMAHILHAQSPSIGFDNNTIVYLDSGRIRYYNMANMTIDTSAILERFESILYIGPDILLAHRSNQYGRFDSIYLVNEDPIVHSLTSGWDPTFVTQDTFVYFDSDNDTTYYLLKNNVNFPASPDTLFTIVSLNRPHWPSYYSTGGRLVFSLVSSPNISVYSAEAYSGTDTLIDNTDYFKPLILGFNLIIFTGPDGRFYQSDFYGTKSFPFTYMKNPN